MCWAREANMRAISVNGERPEVAECSRTSRIFSPAAVPPGSRVTVTERPRARRERASFSICVLLPLPSRPSKVISFPRAGTSEMIAGRDNRVMTAGASRLLARAGSESDPQTDILTCGPICFAVHDSTIRRGNGLKYWGEGKLLSCNLSVVIVSSFWGKWSDRRTLCGRVGSAAQDPARAIAYSGQARDAHALLSKMDSGRARADGSGRRFDRPEVYGEWKDAAMAARSGGRVYFSRGSSGGGERSRRESRLRITGVV